MIKARGIYELVKKLEGMNIIDMRYIYTKVW